MFTMTFFGSTRCQMKSNSKAPHKINFQLCFWQAKSFFGHLGVQNIQGLQTESAKHLQGQGMQKRATANMAL